ncbi:MAG TPA: ATPase domain-containing protein [Candidatus Nanoarchaeia archaeon]|nr:ATPase domain-containing protein [Candidatus Nanoarchaeia archaeon]
MGGNLVKTGIKGLDKQLGGGIPEGALVMVTGSPGTGKTILGMEFLYNGATRYDEPGIMVTFEETAEALVEQARQFNWDIVGAQKQKKLVIAALPANKIEKDSIETIVKIIAKNNIKRLVIDSISTLAFNTPTLSDKALSVEDMSVKRFIYSFIYRIRETGVTGLLISQNSNNGNLSVDGVSEFICDGIISLKFQPMGGAYSRSLIIQKMRNAKNDEDLHPVEISNSGVVVHTLG